MKISDCKSSCQGVSNLFDKTEKQIMNADLQIKMNTHTLIHQDTTIKALAKKPVLQPVIQPAAESDEVRKLKADVLDLKCRSIKYNLILTGLYQER